MYMYSLPVRPFYNIGGIRIVTTVGEPIYIRKFFRVLRRGNRDQPLPLSSSYFNYRQTSLYALASGALTPTTTTEGFSLF